MESERTDEPPTGPPREDEILVTCECQDGTVHVYPDGVFIERAPKSQFTDRWIPLSEITGVTYSKRLVISYLQIEQDGITADSESLFSTPVDTNTVHFGFGKRGCIERVEETIRRRLAAVD
ncbi:hypothetical protein [Halorubrum vacuolatum]|uniref:PH domain-containing protein n=1 Tax=Halorubrum vacuolatum TaxID=63740 RepID=A0A238VTV2_HALVU|nr:hypothetical protein [Halorubrum vacuolatum]SNR37621.1 hypothetical protein SAMN06264855_10461 [Halorubrum vacuolatum]